MKTIDSIPITKISRASKLVSTGAKVGVNYLKYYGDKMVNSKEDAKERLNQNNAEDIYDSLKKHNVPCIVIDDAHHAEIFFKEDYRAVLDAINGYISLDIE